MELVVRKTDLLRELQIFQGIVERKNTIPILANVLMDAKGSEVRLLATDPVHIDQWAIRLPDTDGCAIAAPRIHGDGRNIIIAADRDADVPQTAEVEVEVKRLG